MRHSLTLVALLGALLLAGCAAGPAGARCVEQPSGASLNLPWGEGEAVFMERLRAEGWNVTDRENAIGFDLARDGVRGGGALTPFDEPVRAHLGFRGLLGSYTEAHAREDLAPVVEPLAAALGAEVAYEAGWRVCG